MPRTKLASSLKRSSQSCTDRLRRPTDCAFYQSNLVRALTPFGPSRDHVRKEPSWEYYRRFWKAWQRLQEIIAFLAIPKIELQEMDDMSERSLRSSSSVGSHQTPLYTSDIRLDHGDKASRPAPVSLSDPNSYPEGGSEAWLTVAGCSACLFVSFGWVNCIGVFQN